MIESTIWADPDFDGIEELEPLGFYFYLISNESCNSIGVYRFSARKAVTDARLMPDKIEKYLKLFEEMENPKIRYDHETKWLWVIGLLKRNYKNIRNASIAKSVVRLIEELKDKGFPYYEDFITKNRSTISSVKQQCGTAIGKGKGKGKGKGIDNGKDIEMSKDLAGYLLNSTATALDRKLVSTVESSRVPILKLIKADITPGEIRQTIDWLCHENLTRQYRFDVMSGGSLRDKWDRIQAARVGRGGRDENGKPKLSETEITKRKNEKAERDMKC